MDLHSILRRFLYRNPDPPVDIFVFDDDIKNQRRNKIDYDDDIRNQRKNIIDYDDDIRNQRRNIIDYDDDDDIRNQRRNITDYDGDFHEFDEHIHMFHEVRDLFNSMFMSPFGIMIGFPKFDEQFPHDKSPRSFMLKDSEEKQTEDSCICQENFSKDLGPFQEKGEHVRKPHFFSYSKFSSIKTVRLPDGTIEEHRTVIDNDGNKVTTVRRTIGDNSHEVITKSDTQGIKEKEENFMNMDEGELASFEQKWNKLRSGDIIEPSSPSVGIPPTSPSYWYLIKKFFGSRDSDEIKW